MKKITITLLLLQLFTFAFAQTKYLDRKIIDRLTDSIETEGKALYRSEWASWYGTDIFTEKFPGKQALIGGYISYETSSGLNNIFYSKGDNPMVLVTTSFTKEMDPAKYVIDTTSRKLTGQEMDLYTIRKAAIKRMSSDSTFRVYKNSSLNPVPIINKTGKKVYVLTGPTTNNVVIFGNDYLIDFNQKNEVKSVYRIHNSIIPINTSKATDSTQISIAAVHSHIEGKDKFMTATDICTLMLYERFTTWKTCTVISKDYASVWDCSKNSMIVLTMEAWNRINLPQKTMGNSKF